MLASQTTNPKNRNAETLRKPKEFSHLEAQPSSREWHASKGRESLQVCPIKPPDTGYFDVATQEVEFSGSGEVIWDIQSWGATHA